MPFLPAFVPASQPPALTQPIQAVKGNVTWDDNYIYLSATIDDDDVTGTERAPMSDPTRDDSIGLYVKMGENTSNTPDANAYAMLVSAAGGFTFLQGDATAKSYLPKPTFSIKYGVNVKGTLNKKDDKDVGYVVEMAIPWSAMGVNGKPTPGMQVSWNVVAHKRGAMAPTALSGSFETGMADTLGSKRLVKAEKAPLIDGVINASEWPAAGAFSFAAPIVPVTPVMPAMPVGQNTNPNLTTPPVFSLSSGVPKRLFARYVLTYQADRRKEALPLRDIFDERGNVTLIDQPATGIGPWFSSDRAAWHRTQFMQMRTAGVDVAITEIGGVDSPAAMLDEKALLTSVSALKQMQVDREFGPLLAPLLATEGDKYAHLRRWFLCVPPEFRATVTLPNGVIAYPVFTNTTLDGLAIGDLRTRFAAEFGPQTGGKTVIFASYAGDGEVQSIRVAPGSESVPRNTGATYTKSWEVAIVTKKDWFLLDSWNDFTHATEIAPSRQYGQFYADRTRYFAATLHGKEDRAVRFLEHDAPSSILAGSSVPVNVLVQNVGASSLLPSQKISFGVKWLQNDQEVAKSPLTTPLLDVLLTTEQRFFSFGLLAATQEKDKLIPLPIGDYVAEIYNIEGAVTATPLRLPVTITANAASSEGVQIYSTTTPTLVATEGTYPITVRLRWLGGSVLPLGEAQLALQVLSSDGKRLVSSKLIDIPQALRPGLWEKITVPLTLTDEDENPLLPAAPEYKMLNKPGEIAREGGYRLRLTVVRRGTTIPLMGSYEEPLVIYDREDEGRLDIEDGAKLPETLEAGKRVEIPLSIINSGTTVWRKEAKFAVSYLWYQADGASFTPPAGGTLPGFPLPQSLSPGEGITMQTPITPPTRPGRYVLALFLRRPPETVLSGRPITRQGDTLTIPVTVTGDALTFVNLTPHFTLDAVSREGESITEGDLDNLGGAFPAEWFAAGRYSLHNGIANLALPSGYFTEAASDVARYISFVYGPENSKNAVICNAQNITVPQGRYVALHLVATATGEAETNLSLTLKFKNGKTETITRPVALWTKQIDTTSDDVAALRAPHARSKGADTKNAATLYHIIVPVGVQKELVSISLPANPNVKIFAMTLEK
jgi:hypothetical protein